MKYILTLLLLLTLSTPTHAATQDEMRLVLLANSLIAFRVQTNINKIQGCKDGIIYADLELRKYCKAVYIITNKELEKDRLKKIYTEAKIVGESAEQIKIKRTAYYDQKAYTFRSRSRTYATLRIIRNAGLVLKYACMYHGCEINAEVKHFSLADANIMYSTLHEQRKAIKDTIDTPIFIRLHNIIKGLK